METKLTKRVDELTAQIEQAICDAIKAGAEVKRDMVWRNEIDGLPVFFNIDGNPYMSIQLSADTIKKALRKEDEELIAERDKLQAKVDAIDAELFNRQQERAAA